MLVEPFQAEKKAVRDFWERAACGEELYLRGESAEAYRAQASERYRLEPYIAEFADFESWRGKSVLEIGVGLGADHQRFAEAGAVMTGIDLTPRAIAQTSRRLSLLGLRSELFVADAEQLSFPSNTFDLVYSFGVLHHTPHTVVAVRELLRVLRPGGEFRVMLYNRYSLVGFMLWLRYSGARLRWLSMEEVYSKHLESPGTQAFSKRQTRDLFHDAVDVRIRIVLTHADMLESQAGQRHRGVVLSVARALWPRWLLRRFGRSLGLFALVSGRKAD